MNDNELDSGVAKMNGRALRCKASDELPAGRGFSVSEKKRLDLALRAIEMKYCLPRQDIGFVPKGDWRKKENQEDEFID